MKTIFEICFGVFIYHCFYIILKKLALKIVQYIKRIIEKIVNIHEIEDDTQEIVYKQKPRISKEAMQKYNNMARQAISLENGIPANKYAYNGINYNNYYYPKKCIITLNEQIFYRLLLEICKELDLVLFAQVSLYEIVNVKNNLKYNEQYTYFNKINRKTIDFVLVDKFTCKTKLCIELDDTTHNKQNRIERDDFVNQLFDQLHINLLRQKVQTVYNKEEIKGKILKYLKFNGAIAKNE